jgi:hypothetical protein
MKIYTSWIIYIKLIVRLRNSPIAFRKVRCSVRITRLITPIAAASCLAVVTASPALADGMSLQLVANGIIIGTAATYSDGDTYDVCDRVNDDFGVRGYYRPAKLGGWTGKVSPRQGKCDSRKMPFKIKVSWIKLCEVYLGAERRCQETHT